MPWGFALAGLGTVAGSLISANASQSAAQTEANAANSAAQVQQNMFNTTQSNLAPYMQAGGNALSALQEWLGLTAPPAATQAGTGPSIQDLLGSQGSNNLVAMGAAGATNAPVYSVPQSAGAGWQPGQAGVSQVGYLPGAVQGSGATPTGQQWTAGAVPTATGGTAAGAAPGTIANTGLTPGTGLTAPNAAQYQQSPGYAFQMQQGLQAINNAATVNGGNINGNTLTALTQYGQGLANTDYQQWYNNQVAQQQQTYNMLMGLTGTGANASANLGGLSSTTAGQIGNSLTSAGSALAAGQTGSANAATSGLNSLNNIGSNYLLSQALTNLGSSSVNLSTGGY